MSSITLTKKQESILSKGLTFSLTSGEPDMSQLRWNLDKFHLGLKRHVFFNRDAPVSGDSGALRRSQSSTQLNLSQSQIPSSSVSSSTSMTELTPSHTLNVFENIGPFEHQEWRNPLGFVPKQNPRSLETFINMNETELSKVIFGKNEPENITGKNARPEGQE